MRILLVQPPCYVGDPLLLCLNDYSFLEREGFERWGRLVILERPIPRFNG